MKNMLSSVTDPPMGISTTLTILVSIASAMAMAEKTSCLVLIFFLPEGLLSTHPKSSRATMIATINP